MKKQKENLWTRPKKATLLSYKDSSVSSSPVVPVRREGVIAVGHLVPEMMVVSILDGLWGRTATVNQDWLGLLDRFERADLTDLRHGVEQVVFGLIVVVVVTAEVERERRHG